MWGSTFSDFAKKAQELQEQATVAASSISHSNAASSLFNLDAIRQEDEDSPKPSDHERPITLESASATMSSSSATMGRLFQSIHTPQIISTATATTPPSPSKLKVPSLQLPSDKSSSLPSPTLTSPQTQSKLRMTLPKKIIPQPVTTTPRTPETTKADDVIHDGSGDDANGWGDDEDGLIEDLHAEGEKDVDRSRKEHTPVVATEREVKIQHAINVNNDEAARLSVQPPDNATKLSLETTTIIIPDQPKEKDDDDEEHDEQVQVHSRGDDNHSPEKFSFKDADESVGNVAQQREQQQASETIVQDSSPDPMSPQHQHKQLEATLVEEPTPLSVVTSETVATSTNDGSVASPQSPHRVLIDRDTETEEKRPVASAATVEETAAAAVVPEQLMEQFSLQIQRLEENHHAEQAEMERRYVAQIQELQASCNHNACEKARWELQKTLQAQIREKEDQLHEVMRINEGLELKMDVLKREVTGTEQLLQAKKSDIGKTNEEHLRCLREMEKQLIGAEEKGSAFQKETEQFKARLESVNDEFSCLKKDHADLKSRVKTVAGELKDRRVECRELQGVIQEKEEANKKLSNDLENLRYQIHNQDRSSTEKNEEMEQLQANLVDAQNEIAKAEKVLKDHEAKAEKVLADYKRKAQSSLALANSRAATAIQAKEEAELEARAARSTADTAMERAVTAEIASKGIVAQAKARVSEMEKEKKQAVEDMEAARDELKESVNKLAETKNQLRKSNQENERISEALKLANSNIAEVKSAASLLQEQLVQSNARANSLRDDIATLREQLVRAEAAAQSETKKEIEEEVVKATSSNVSNGPGLSSDDATVRILQEELRDANKAIEELKEALANAVKSVPHDNNRVGNRGEPTQRSNDDSSSTPLFYAMEKQAELNTARDEINRLANFLSSIQSEKMEARESMELMRKRMEEAEARLMRFEKLSSPAADALLSPEPFANGAGRRGSGAVNIEYLKNIMLRYLNAKTLAEKKALVPVIGAVLCLTPDEQKAAVGNIEAGASLGSVGSSLFETLSGNFL